MNEITLAPSRLPIPGVIARDYDLTPANWRVLVESIFPAAKTIEAVLTALAYCKARNLDIFKKPVHIVPMYNAQLGRYVETVWEGIASIRTTASRTGAYAGIDAVEYGPTIIRTFTGEKATYDRGRKSGSEQIKKEVRFPEWASVIVWRVVGGVRCPYHAKVYWEESYATAGKGEVPNDMWARRPYGQLDKCVEAAALRKAFPEELGSTYTADEMEGHTIEGALAPDVPAITPPKPPAKEEPKQKAPPKPPGKKADSVKMERGDTTSPKASDQIGSEFERLANEAADAEEADRVEQGHSEAGEGAGQAEELSAGELLSELDEALGTAKTPEDVATIYDDYDLEARLESVPNGEHFIGVAIGIKRRHAKRVAG